MRYLIVLVVGFIISCSGSAHPCPPVPAPPGPPGPSDPVLEQGLKIDINKERQLRGLPMIVSTKELDCAALAHAQDISRIGVCTHTGSDGSQFWERAKRCGTRASGEIIACGQTTKEQAVRAWVNSPGHAAIMFDRKQIAMGAARAGNYWVVIFMK